MVSNSHKPKQRITKVHQEWMITDFAMGYTVAYVWHKLLEQGVDVTWWAVKKWYRKWIEDGTIAKRRAEIIKDLPLADKNIRIKHLESEFAELQQLKRAATPVDRLELIDKLLKVLRQAAEEMGDIGKGGGGLHLYQDFRGNGKRNLPEDERADLIRILQGEAKRHTD